MFYPRMQQYVFFNVLKEYCISKEEEEEDSNNILLFLKVGFNILARVRGWASYSVFCFFFN